LYSAIISCCTLARSSPYFFCSSSIFGLSELIAFIDRIDLVVQYSVASFTQMVSRMIAMPQLPT
jgi:hypothetical protein